MKRVIAVLLALAAVYGAAAGNLFAEEAKVTGSASMGIFNRYVFRGYEFSSDSIVIQPAINLSYQGFGVGFWANIDTDEHTTQSFLGSGRLGHKSFNETDFTLSYTYALGKLSLTGGYVYYALKYAAETEEVFLIASYDIIAKPTLSIYRDITSYPGTYISLALSHSVPLYKTVTLDLGASAGYFVGDDKIFRTVDGSGKRYRAFHDGLLKAGLTIPVVKNTVLQPVVSYSFPISDRARRHSYNPNGHIDDTITTGISVVFTF
ncbi:MAG: hypothetical protein U0411_06805 [Thermodesulfovibrionales bacterium]